MQHNANFQGQRSRSQRKVI